MISGRLRYTLLIPIYNRSAHLRRLLGYLAARPVRISGPRPRFELG
jgi:hypothetical protein